MQVAGRDLRSRSEAMGLRRRLRRLCDPSACTSTQAASVNGRTMSCSPGPRSHWQCQRRASKGFQVVEETGRGKTGSKVKRRRLRTISARSCRTT